MITQAVVVPTMALHGFALTLDEAKAAFAEHWTRAWILIELRRL